MKREVFGAAAIAAAMCATAVSAQSLKDKEYFASEEKSLAEKVPYVNERCGTTIAVSFDWSTPPSPRERTVYSASGICGEVLDGIRHVCDASHAGKDAVRRTIKKLTCGFGPQRLIALKNATIEYKIGNNSPGWDADYVFEYLQGNL
jgi:hypothetical protein